MSKYRNFLLSVIGIILIAAPLFSQMPTKGNLTGTVTDAESGSPLPGVTVEATSPSLLGKVTAVTDGSGRYRLLALTPGLYSISYSLDGFNTITRTEIVVNINATVTVDVTMGLGAIEEEVTVIGQSPLVDVKSTTKGMTITKIMFEILPKGRNFDTLVTAVPGVNNEPWLGGVSVDGASAAENMYFVDGTDITRIDTGRSGQGAAFEFVEEVQIIASGYEAEYGGALGGVVSVITRQGGNAYHGELIGYYSGSKLNGKERDVLRQTPDNRRVAEYFNYQDAYGKDNDNRYEVGASLGGYLLRDRIWFFGSLLPVFRPIERHVEFLTGEEGDYKQKNTSWNYQAKLTAQPIGFMRIGASFLNNFSQYRGSLPSRVGTSNYDDPNWAKYGFDYPNWTASGFADMSLGTNLMVNVRGGMFRYNTSNQQITGEATGEPRWLMGGEGTHFFDGTALEIPASLQKPRNWQNRGRIYDTERLIKRKAHVGADFTYFMDLAGEHSWKFGVQWVRQGEDTANVVDSNYPETYFRWGRPAVVSGYNYGTGTYGHVEVRGNADTGPFGEFFNVHNDRWSLYAQDAWTIGEKLTLNIGIRAESEYIPPFSEDPSIPSGFKPIEFSFGDKLAPRLGFIYDVMGDATLKVFGSYGLYYDVIKTYMPAHSYAGFKWKSAYYAVDNPDWTQWTGGNTPGALLAVIDHRTPSFDSTDPDLKPVSQREISFGAEKMVMENLSATLRVVNKHLRHTIEDVGVIVPGQGEKYYETNPGYGYSLHVGNGTGKFDPKYPETPRASREYWAVNFSLDKRMADNWLGGFSYTWSSLTGNYSGLGSSDEFGRTSPYVERSFDNWAMAFDKSMSILEGPLPTDRPHFFKLYGAYTFPFRLTVGAVLNAMSGVPVSETYSILGTYWYPWNRGYYRDDSGNLVQERSPFLWFGNLYAEYNLKITDRYRVQVNINVDNFLNTSTARRVYQTRTLNALTISEDAVLSTNWDVLTTPGIEYEQHPMFLKEMDYYSPISARLGLKFLF
jgi:hypothetical protein